MINVNLVFLNLLLVVNKQFLSHCFDFFNLRLFLYHK